jgi:hypothetical protein
VLIPGVTVTPELKNALEKRAAADGITLPDARREAYRLYVGGINAAIIDS